MKRAKLVMALMCGATAVAAEAQSSAQVAQTDTGAVSGQVEDGVASWKGVPYAAAPVGPLRWRAPQPPAKWSGTREAVQYAHDCMQKPFPSDAAPLGTEPAEDCLYANVWKPAGANGKLPVLVWIYGGGFVNGGASPPTYSGANLAKQGIMFVSFNYRVGRFGTFAFPQLTKENPDNGRLGNYGIMDQIAALRWVHDNITKFGGDPNNVTIAGESAGSQDVSLLLAAPGARGLFEKAIMESGTPGFGLSFRSLADAERLGLQADDMLNAGGSVEKMRHMSVPALLAVDLKLHDENMQSDGMMWLRTTVDGNVFPSDPRTLLQKAPPRPVILGTNKIELGADRAQRDSIIAREFGPNEAAARAYYHADQPNPPDDPRLGSLDDQIGTDVIFRCPAERFAQLLSGRGATVWRYEFDSAPNGAKTSHAAEIPYAFWDSTFAPGLSMKPYWINFIRTGDPNGADLPRWPTFTSSAQQHVLFDAKGVTVEGPLRPQLCSLEDRL